MHARTRRSHRDVATAEAQLATGAQPGILSVQEAWRTKADAFVASCYADHAELLAKHAQARAELPAKISSIAP